MDYSLLHSLSSRIHLAVSTPVPGSPDMYTHEGAEEVEEQVLLPHPRSASHLNTSHAPFGFLHPFSLVRGYWNAYVLILILYTSVELPFRLSFMIDDMPTALYAVDLIVDVSFIIDVILNFRTGYWDEEEKCICYKPNRIAMHYLKGWFTVDALSALPFDYIASMIAGSSQHDAWWLRAAYVCRFARLARIGRLLRIFQFTRMLGPEQDKRTEPLMNDSRTSFLPSLSPHIRVIKWAFMLFLCNHWNSCWLYFVSYLYDFGPRSWVGHQHLDDEPKFTVYSVGFFTSFSAMMSCGYGSYTPVLPGEIWAFILVMITGGLVYAVLVAKLLTTFLEEKSTVLTYRKKMDRVSQYSKARRLPPALQAKIGEYYFWKLKKKRALDEQEVMKHLSMPLRKEIAMYTCRKLVRDVYFVGASQDPSLVSWFVSHVHSEIYLSGDWIFREGELPSHLYFLGSGEVELLLGEAAAPTKDRMGVVRDGGVFGEIGVVEDAKRHAYSARTTCVSDVYSLRREDVLEMMEVFPAAREGILDTLKERKLKIHSMEVQARNIGRLPRTSSLRSSSSEGSPVYAASARLEFLNPQSNGTAIPMHNKVGESSSGGGSIPLYTKGEGGILFKEGGGTVVAPPLYTTKADDLSPPRTPVESPLQSPIVQTLNSPRTENLRTPLRGKMPDSSAAEGNSPRKR